jgi:competence protein ComEA
MFDLTHEERRVILFLMIIAFLGLGINLLSRLSPHSKFTGCLLADIPRINLNTADKDLLMALPGIKEKLAQRIMDYRKEHAGFQEVEELKQIKGITNSKYEKIKDSLSLK